METRKIIGNILLILTIIYTLYLSTIMINRIHNVVLKGPYIRVFVFELVACLFFLLFSLDVRFNIFGISFLKVLRIITTTMVAILLFFIIKVSVGGLFSTNKKADYALVLGLALENGQPTKDLIYRLDTAEKYINDNPDATLILTGGNPDESGKTEAQVMYDILVEKGIDSNRLILEDQAHSTKENFKNTIKMIDPNKPIVLISSNYHMDRAVQTAKKAGFKNVLRYPAPSNFIQYPANIMWEVILEINEISLRH